MARASKLLAGGVFFVLGAIAVFAPGCQGRECDGDLAFYGFKPNEGTLVDPNTYETGALKSDWLQLPHQRTYVIRPVGLENRLLIEPVPYISPVVDPNADGGTSNFTVGSGNIAELRVDEFNNILVHNDTCADYYLRLVVHALPESDAGPVIDAAGDAPNASDGAADGGDGAPE